MGLITAKGGAQSGNGGFVEVSGKQTLAFNGRSTPPRRTVRRARCCSIRRRSPLSTSTLPDINGNGTTGDDITGAGDLDNAAGDFAGANSTITDDALEGLLAANSVTLAATSAITVNVQLDWASAQSLTLDAPTLNLNADIAPTGAGTFIGGGTVVTINVNSLAPGGGTIGDALVLASNGDVINVGAGTYNEALTINKEVTLNGAQAGISAVTGGRTSGGVAESIIVGTGLTIAANNVEVDGFDLQLTSNGIILDTSATARQNFTITNNFLTNSTGSGIGIVGGNGFAGGSNLIARNSIVADDFGIVLNHPGGLGAGGSFTVSDNSISAADFDAIRANSNDSLIVTGNTLSIGGSGSAIGVISDANAGVSNVTIGGNTITGANLGTGINIEDFDADAGTIELVFQSGNSISDVANGVVLSGIGISMPQQSFSDLAFVNISGNYIELQNVAVAQIFIGATQVTFNGLTYAASGGAAQAIINGKIVDNADDGTLSVIVLEATDVNVTAVQGLDGIQDAIVVIEGFGGGADVLLEAGTYGGVVNGSAANGIVITGSDIGIVGDAMGGTVLDFSAVSTTNAITVNGANTALSNLNLTGLATISNAAIKVNNGPFTITGGSIIATGATSYGLLIDPPGPITVSGMTLANFAVDAVNIANTAGNVIVTGNTINGTGNDAINIENTSVGVGAGNIGSITVAGNTIGNDNTGVTANIGGSAIEILNTTSSGNITVDGNLIATGANAATVGSFGILITNAVAFGGGISVTNNELGTGTGATLGNDGIQTNTTSGTILISNNTVFNAGVDGVSVNSATGPVTVTGLSINNVGDDGISFSDVSSGTISNVSIVDVSFGVYVNDSVDDVPNNVTITTTTIDNAAIIGIYIADSDLFGNSTTTVTLGAGNVIQSIAAGATAAIVIAGPDTALGGNSLNNIQFLAIDAAVNFVELQSAALFNPDAPTVIDGSQAVYDLNNNGVIDAGEDFSLVDASQIDTQAELDTAWGAGVFLPMPRWCRRVSSITSTTRLSALISPLGNVLIVNSPTDWGGGLRGIQNAINAASTGYSVFVNAGVYGAPAPFPGPVPAATSPLTIDDEIRLIGRRGFDFGGQRLGSHDRRRGYRVGPRLHRRQHHQRRRHPRRQ